jgi:hypothetical protein
MMFSAQKKSKGSNPPLGEAPKPRTSQYTGRERFCFVDGELKRANEAIGDLEKRVERLGSIISESEINQRKLQDAINADGGIALAEFSAGKSDPDSDIAKLVTVAEASQKAANAAKVALPSTEAMLESARSQAAELREKRNSELNRVLANLADVDAKAYDRAFAEVCRLHDRLVGYSQVAQSNIGDIRLVLQNPSVPRFALPSLGNGDADPHMRHRENEIVVAESARTWATVRSRLESDVDADLSDILL